MEVRDKLYELTNDIDNIGLYDPEKRRKEEEELKIEYHTTIAREEGMEKGIERGLERGKEEGAKQKQKSIVKSMLAKKMDLSLISELTGLSKSQISMLK